MIGTKRSTFLRAWVRPLDKSHDIEAKIRAYRIVCCASNCGTMLHNFGPVTCCRFVWPNHSDHAFSISKELAYHHRISQCDFRARLFGDTSFTVLLAQQIPHPRPFCSPCDSAFGGSGSSQKLGLGLFVCEARRLYRLHCLAFPGGAGRLHSCGVELPDLPSEPRHGIRQALQLKAPEHFNRSLVFVRSIKSRKLKLRDQVEYCAI